MCREVEEPVGEPGMDEKVVAVYKGVGLIMKRFTTGKVPKAFKIIPNLQNWEEVQPISLPSQNFT
jgi:essential nuclear protein 1